MGTLENSLSTLNDLEVVDLYIEKCQQFVNPRLLGEVTRRGLYDIINFLPHNRDEAKAVAYARLGKMGKVFNEPEIDHISAEISRLESLRK